MSEINVKVRWRAQTLYDTKVIIEFEETVRVLKKKICEKDSSLQENLIEIIYCGCVMEDCNAMYMYDIFDGATVHAFKRDKCEKQPPNKPITDGDLVKLGVAFRSLSLNSSYRSALMKLSKPEVITNVILTTPGLNEDPVALTLLQHSELLVKLSDFDVLKRISESHPALAAAALQIAAAVHEEVLQNHFATDLLARNMLNNGSDDDIEDIDDSSPASEASNQPSAFRSSSFGAITAAQLASAIASVTTQQPQPSTSSAGTSTGSTESPFVSALENLRNVQNEPNPPDNNLSTQLQIMREMGLTNEAVNIEALRISSDLETAIELVLSGFTI